MESVAGTAFRFGVALSPVGCPPWCGRGDGDWPAATRPLRAARANSVWAPAYLEPFVVPLTVFRLLYPLEVALAGTTTCCASRSCCSSSGRRMRGEAAPGLAAPRGWRRARPGGRLGASPPLPPALNGTPSLPWPTTALERLGCWGRAPAAPRRGFARRLAGGAAACRAAYSLRGSATATGGRALETVAGAATTTPSVRGPLHVLRAEERRPVASRSQTAGRKPLALVGPYFGGVVSLAHPRGEASG